MDSTLSLPPPPQEWMDDIQAEFDDLFEQCMTIPEFEKVIMAGLRRCRTGKIMIDYLIAENTPRNREYHYPEPDRNYKRSRIIGAASRAFTLGTYTQYAIYNTKGVRDAVCTKKGKVVKTRLLKFAEIIEAADRVRCGEASRYDSSSNAIFYKKSNQDVSSSDWTYPNGSEEKVWCDGRVTTINHGRWEQYDEGGISHYSRDQKDVLRRRSYFSDNLKHSAASGNTYDLYKKLSKVFKNAYEINKK